LVTYEPRTGASLTDAGNKLALHVLRRHRLVELFLVRIVGLDWSEVHDEAEELEHVISEKVLERIDALLGRPKVDPHGDPIPDAAGQVAHTAMHPLSGCADGDTICVERVNNQDPKFLRVITELCLLPGTVHRVTKNDTVAGTLTLTAADGTGHVIGTRAAESILVRAAEPETAGR
jgi:DtxR family Mn-dependent transcriptional regulator